MKGRRSIFLILIATVCLAAAIALCLPRWSEVKAEPLGYAALDEGLRLIYESAPSSREGGKIVLGAQVQYAGFTDGKDIPPDLIRKALGTDVDEPQPFELQFGHDIHVEGEVVKAYWQKRYAVTLLTQTRKDGTEERTVTAYVPVEPLLQLHYYAASDATDGELQLVRIEYYAFDHGSYSMTGAEQFQ